MATLKKHRILILGVSGYLGSAIYKELHSYYQTFGTYKTPLSSFENNKHFFHYDFEEDDVFEILNVVKPTIIISALRGDFAAQLTAHKHVFEYIISQKKCKMIFLSSANVFDAYSKFPSYENDTTLSNSVYGHFKIIIHPSKMSSLSVQGHLWRACFQSRCTVVSPSLKAEPRHI
mgnify:CR=1 FL=1